MQNQKHVARLALSAAPLPYAPPVRAAALTDKGQHVQIAPCNPPIPSPQGTAQPPTNVAC
jgi:hypothetical protein